MRKNGSTVTIARHREYPDAGRRVANRIPGRGVD